MGTSTSVGPVGNVHPSTAASVLLLALACAGRLPAQGAGTPVTLVPQTGHSGFITDLAVSPDGRLALSASSDFSAVLWDVPGRREIRSLTGHRGAVTSVALDAHRREALTGSEDGTLRLWDLETGEEIRRYSTGEPSVVTRFLAAFRNRQARAQEAYRGIGTAVALGPAGRFVAARTEDGTHLWDRATGRHLRRFEGYAAMESDDGGGHRAAVVFSADGRVLFRADSRDEEIRRWEVGTGEELEPLRGHTDGVTDLALGRGGAELISGSRDGTVRVWSAVSGATVDAFHHGEAVTSVALTADGQWAVAASGAGPLYGWDRQASGTRYAFDKVMSETYPLATPAGAAGPDSPASSALVLGGGYRAVLFWDAAQGDALGGLLGEVSSPPTALAATSSSLIVGSGEDAWDWDLVQGHPLRRYPTAGLVADLAVSTDGRRLFTGSSDSLAAWDREALEGVVMDTGPDRVAAVAVSPDGEAALSADADGRVWWWDLADLSELGGRVVLHTDDIPTALAIHPDGRLAAVADYDGVRLFDLEDEEEVGRLRRGDSEDFDFGSSIRFHPQGTMVMAGSTVGDVRIWRLEDRREVRRLTENGGSVEAVAWDASGTRAFTGGEDGIIREWDIAGERVLRRFTGHSFGIRDLEVLPEGDWLASASQDGTVRLWDLRSGRLAATLLMHRWSGDARGRWAVVTPDGRFDANLLEEVQSLYWTVADDPMNPLAVETFMRDYYQPDLMRRVLARDPLPPVRDVSTLNRTQPRVSVERIEPIPGRTDSLEVTIRAVGTGSASPSSVRAAPAGPGGALDTGVYDLRLFRDGHLVARYPGLPETGGQSASPVTPEEVRAWRAQNRVPAKDTLLSFRVQVPVRPGADSVTFSAYAFNDDRVKSVTHRLTYRFGRALRRRTGTAYVVSIGVSDSGDPGLRLTFPNSDVKLLTDSLPRVLARSGAFVDTVTVPLMTRPPRGNVLTLPAQQTLPGTGQPTKGMIREALRRLAGGDPGGEVGPSAMDPDTAALSRLRAATPDDIVLLTFSGHGVTHPETGEFYLLPSDVPEAPGAALTPEQYRAAISASELSAWLEPVDAGRIVLVIGSCYSTAAVEQEGFKPGPMGDRGLGQLAYDKGIQIVAASQSEALEWGGHGVLAYALAIDGLGRSDGGEGPETLSGLLQHARDRVPYLLPGSAPQTSASSRGGQRAALFDFKPQQIQVQLKPTASGGSLPPGEHP
jgi:WD40 repeat protein